MRERIVREAGQGLAVELPGPWHEAQVGAGHGSEGHLMAGDRARVVHLERDPCLAAGCERAGRVETLR